MYYVYVLRSDKTDKYYFGSTVDLKRRFYQHNQAQNIATKAGVPWALVYYEAYTAKSIALQRERKLKQYGQTWRRLRERLHLAE
jgi:putative endonuclease